MTSYFQDKSFQEMVLALAVKDRVFLQNYIHLLSPKDFRLSGEGKSSRYVIAKLAIEYFDKYREPIKDMLRAEALDYAKRRKLPTAERSRLLKLCNRLKKKKVTAVSSITDKVVEFKKDVKKAEAIQRLIDAQASGSLTDEKWNEIHSDVSEVIAKDPYKSVDYFAELEDRILRRSEVSDSRFPVSFIEPLDALVRLIARGHLGLVLAPYKRGKSLMLMWLALALVLQRYNVLYITLEDPVEDLSDRLDANISKLPIKKLGAMPKKLRERFRKFKRLLRTRIEIVDATEGGLTVPGIQTIFERYRDKGFLADAIIVDYDDELQAVRKHPERRHEFAEIYRGLRRLAAKNDAIVWTAAQTKRATANLKVLSGDDAAEDISKIRKVTCCLTIGQGDWGEGSLYLNVAAHKVDRQGVGANIMANFERMLIYDREATFKEMKKQFGDQIED